MHRRPLGNQGPQLPRLALGCMGMSDFYGTADEAESIRTIHRAIELGVNFLDTADMYGVGKNERLVGKAIADRRDQVFVATKFAVVRSEDGAFLGVNGRPEYVRSACDASLARLGVETIDLYYQHRVDPQVPIEETVGAMAELVTAGKVRLIGLSEAGAETIRRAHKIHPITALQSEYSLWTRDPEPAVLPTIRQLGIGFVAYSPLGRGFLAGKFDSRDDLANNDWRRNFPRMSEEHFETNLALVRSIRAMASDRGATAAQVALAWLLAQGDDIFPLFGTTRVSRLEENLGALSISLSDDEMATLDRVFHSDAAAGTRYPAATMHTVNR